MFSLHYQRTFTRTDLTTCIGLYYEHCLCHANLVHSGLHVINNAFRSCLLYMVFIAILSSVTRSLSTMLLNATLSISQYTAYIANIIVVVGFSHVTSFVRTQHNCKFH